MQKKRYFRTMGLLFACVMLVSVSALALAPVPNSTASISCGCSCGHTGAAAYTNYEVPVMISSSFSGTYWISTTESGNTGNSHYTSGTSSYCSDSYPYALSASIESFHEAGSEYAWDSDNF